MKEVYLAYQHEGEHRGVLSVHASPQGAHNVCLEARDDMRAKWDVLFAQQPEPCRFDEYYQWSVVKQEVQR